MDDAGAIFRGHEVRIHDEERRFIGYQVLVERLVPFAQQALRIDIALDLVLALENREARLCQDVMCISLAYPHVRNIETHSQCHVAGERPGGRRPGQKICLRLVF